MHAPSLPKWQASPSNLHSYSPQPRTLLCGFSSSCSQLLMDFYHRKLNPLSKWRDIVLDVKHDIQAIDQQYPNLSTPFPPLPLKHEGDISKSMHLLHKLIIVACVVTTVLVIFIVLNQLRKLKSRRNHIRQRNPSVVFAVHEDLVPEDREHGPELDHPIWYINFVGLQQSVIDSIAVCKYRNGDGLIEGTDCSICLSEFEENEDLRLLPKCSHAFHIPCIDTWLRSHKNCPLCRAPIIQDSSNTQSGVEIRRSNSNETIPIHESQLQVSVQNGTEAIESRVRSFSSAEDGRVDEITLTNLPDSNMIRCHSRILSDLAHRGVAVEDEVQPVRRSVSMDASSASMIYNAVAKLNPDQAISENLSTRGSRSFNSGGKIAAVAKRASRSWSMCKMNSMGRALQKGPLSMKRSFSSGRKFLSSRHCRSQSCFLPSPM